MLILYQLRTRFIFQVPVFKLYIVSEFFRYLFHISGVKSDAQSHRCTELCLQTKHNLMLQAGISRLLNLVQPATEQLLERIWSNEYLEKLGSHPNIKAYKYIPSTEIYLLLDDQAVYFPSRIKRCIVEAAGEIIRSQYKRKQCLKQFERLYDQYS